LNPEPGTFLVEEIFTGKRSELDAKGNFYPFARLDPARQKSTITLKYCNFWLFYIME
jgi:hypothetical protein